MMPSIRVVIADDHPVVIEGLEKSLAQTASIGLVGTAHSYPALVELLARVAADVLVLDLSDMGGSPLALMNRLQREYPQLRVLVYSSTIDLAPEMFDAGAHGYVTKGELLHEVERAITTVAQGEYFVSPLVQEYLDQSAKETSLTSKELVALKLLVQGKTTAQIAAQMGVHLHTAQNHITALRRKTGCMQRTQLVEWYRRVYGDNR